MEQSGRLTGSVANASSKEPLAGANVAILGTPYGATTDSAGRFRILAIPAGRYRVRVSLVGFAPLVFTDIDINPVASPAVICMLAEAPVQIAEADVVAEYPARSPDFPLSSYGLSSGELRRQPGGLDDVARTAGVMPGVARIQVGRNDLIVRGGAPAENLSVVDGFVFPSINHFATQGVGGGPVSFVNVEFVDKTFFSSGGFGVRYGDKLSSVLSIDLRNGRTDRIGASATLSATQFGASIEGPLGGGGSGFLTIRRTYLDVLFRAAGISFVPQYYDLLGKASYRLGPNDELLGIVAGALDDLHLFNETEEQRKENAGILRSNQKQFFGGLAWSHLFPKGYVKASLNRWMIEYDNLQSDVHLAPAFTDLSTEGESSLDIETAVDPSPGTEITLGGRAASVRISSTADLRQFWTPFGELIPDTRLQRDTASFKGTLFAQVSRQLTGRLRATVGGRIDYFALLRQGAGKALRGSATYLLARGLNLSGSIGRYYQSPSAVWLVSNPRNSALTLIRLDCGALGLEQVFWDDWKASLEGYLKSYSDYPANIYRPYLVQANTGAAFDYGYGDSFASFGFEPLTSGGQGRSRGVELSLQKKLSGTPYYGMLNLSVSEVRFTALDGIERPGAFDQRVIVNLLLGGRPSEAWEIGMRFRFATGQPYTPYDEQGKQKAARLYAERFSPAHSLDLRVDRWWHFSAWNLSTYVDVQNIYNRRNQVYNHYSYSKGKIEMEERIGIIPTVGIIAEF